MGVLLVGVGGFFGAIARYSIFLLFGILNPKMLFPIPTLTVNVVGCFLLGWITSSLPNYSTTHPIVLALVIGFLGAFTTFSAFGFETFELFQDQKYLIASINIAANNLICLGAVYSGMKIGSF